jgi:hypothetical protein
VFREALFPSLEFRRTYDALVVEGADQADLDYVRILHLAASDGEECVRTVLASLLAAAIAPTYETVRAEVRGPRNRGKSAVSELYASRSCRLRPAPGREHCGGVRMSAATITRDETLELRLKALRLPSFLEQYIELAERAAAEGWSHVRYLAELVTHEAEDRADRRITRLLLDAKLPRDKSVATLDLNRYAGAPARARSANCCAASSSLAQPTSA